MTDTTPDLDAEAQLWQRRMKALTMRNAGATYERIAQQLGVSAATARKDIRLAYREVLNETPEDMLARQRSILLDIARVNYPNALQGDREATATIMKALEHEAKLFGLYAPTRVAVGVSDVQFAEQTAELLAKLNMDIPKELEQVRTPLPTDSRRVDVPPVVDAETVDEITDTEETPSGHVPAEDDDTTPRRPADWSNL